MPKVSVLLTENLLFVGNYDLCMAFDGRCEYVSIIGV